MENKIIIIGGDHHNTLAVLRCIGRNYKNYEIIIYGNQTDIDKLKISHSKYVHKNISLVHKLEDEIIETITRCNTTEKLKNILLPCSDYAEYIIDKNYDVLANNNIVPGFMNAPGQVGYYMDKFNQKKLADENNLKMAKTWDVELSNLNQELNIIFPCIIKPYLSAFGNKDDICICNNITEFNNKAQHLKERGYKKFLIQEFLDTQGELCLIGCIYKDINNDILLKKSRVATGSTLFATVIDDKEYKKDIDKVTGLLKEMNYCGLYDIEFFICNDGIYLNEINFRSSGIGYCAIDKSTSVPYRWCLYASDNVNEITNKFKASYGANVQNDIDDFSNRKTNGISTARWIRDFIKAKYRAYFDIKDLKGSFYYYKKAFFK